MGEIKVKIPEELEETMKEFKLNWSEVAAKAIFDKAEQLKRLKYLSSKINISDEDAKKLADKINEGVAAKYLTG